MAEKYRQMVFTSSESGLDDQPGPSNILAAATGMVLLCERC